MADLPRLVQSGVQVPLINHSIDDFTPQDFMDYEFMASNYIHSTDDVNPSKPIPSLAVGFKDPLVRDWYKTDIARLSCLSLPSFIAEMRATFLPRGWDEDIRDSILSSKQGDGEAVALWISRLRAENTLLRNTRHHLSNDDLLLHFKQNLNSILSAANRPGASARKESDLTKWILQIKRLEADSRLERGPQSNVQDGITSRPSSPDRSRHASNSKHKRSRSRDSDSRHNSRSKRVSSRSPSRAHRRRRHHSNERNTDRHWEPSTGPSRDRDSRDETRSISPSHAISMPTTATDVKSERSPSPLSIAMPGPIVNHHGLPVLTAGQRQFIARSNGCFKCRRIKVKHQSDHCPFGYPSQDAYRGITLADGVTLASDAKKLSSTAM
ncbi:uncharacterized protein EV420DRAFT_1076059 [Desarmillaria tabescens]|uniref:Retrotransposon gag domain-containing protein n=1 Tax=Armillaria tabescens TaxID=1929756 RepID=A0AA39MPN1_ARMTA|nr:uncharacterized protein EV420DRAFT_1076059 [Desarmillaria tabescens]KAK0442486.1 hypothetical protein EV420DRAFT_1076059 [Desarmillaria tabescens]